MSEYYTCAVCNETFGKGLTDEQAVEQLGTEFPGVDVDDCYLVCDNCYQRRFGAALQEGNCES